MQIWRVKVGLKNGTYAKFFTKKDLAEVYIVMQMRDLIADKDNFKLHGDGGTEFCYKIDFDLDSYTLHSDESGLTCVNVLEDEQDDESPQDSE